MKIKEMEEKMKKCLVMVVSLMALGLLNVIGIECQEEKVEPAVKAEAPVSGEAQVAFDKGTEYYKQGKYDDAIVEFKNAISVEPNYAKAYCEMGMAYMEKEDFEGSIPNLLKCIEIQYKYPKAHYAIAVAYARQKNPDLINARKHVDIAAQQGYMVVPWFLDYLKRLEDAAK